MAPVSCPYFARKKDAGEKDGLAAESSIRRAIRFSLAKGSIEADKRTPSLGPPILSTTSFDPPPPRQCSPLHVHPALLHSAHFISIIHHGKKERDQGSAQPVKSVEVQWRGRIKMMWNQIDLFYHELTAQQRNALFQQALNPKLSAQSQKLKSYFMSQHDQNRQHAASEAHKYAARFLETTDAGWILQDTSSKTIGTGELNKSNCGEVRTVGPAIWNNEDVNRLFHRRFTEESKTC
ncbi:Protein of unknown function [Pyronema omphalodes CBS 100304]|uniref:Uncharacterized protein n=1 Tax=Pyronema omphalodes (strain CBS 100304) TaxID=1076935 RepID=U4KUM0_PYROM|nr:Protein of unknown function [Pyronema omphalodes CBS 100304]